MKVRHELVLLPRAALATAGTSPLPETAGLELASECSTHGGPD